MKREEWGKYSQHAKNNFTRPSPLKKLQVSSAVAIALKCTKPEHASASGLAEELRTEIELGDLNLKTLRNSGKVVI